MKFPKHKCGLYLEHNRYKDYYETPERAVKDLDDDNWISKEEKEEFLKTGEIWELQWYPNTPIGFYVYYAADLNRLLDFCNTIEEVHEAVDE